ncbi:ABC transporter permease [Massilia sp. W12]|uniref:ABC transporter permease n=1 Tax=Massilia sp. W12 TaxID=3126507 RepID=UPI0030D00251
MEVWAQLIASAISAGTPLLLAACGLLINEKCGVVNLGAEGMMALAAVCGFAVALGSGAPGLGLLAAALAGMAGALLFAALCLGLGANQYACGLALALLGGGLASYLGLPYAGASLRNSAPGIPGLSELPFLGQALFSQHWLAYFALALAVFLHWFFKHSRAGLVLRAVGESPQAAHALGFSVQRMRLLALLAGGACCGLAGGFLSLVYTPLWVDGMVAGRGWIALALTTFASWRPLRLLLGAWLFGGVTILGFHAQAQGVQIASQFLSMLPYLAAIAVLVFMSRRGSQGRDMPAAMGQNFESRG